MSLTLKMLAPLALAGAALVGCQRQSPGHGGPSAKAPDAGGPHDEAVVERDESGTVYTVNNGPAAGVERDSVDILGEILREGSPKAQKDAINQLGKMGSERAMAHLEWAALNARDPEVRNHALKKLRHLSTPRATETFILALTDEDARNREEAADSLKDLRAASAVDPLIEALRTDPHHEVREAAAEALGAIGDLRAVDALTAATRDPNGEVSAAARVALARLTHR